MNRIHRTQYIVSLDMPYALCLYVCLCLWLLQIPSANYTSRGKVATLRDFSSRDISSPAERPPSMREAACLLPGIYLVLFVWPHTKRSWPHRWYHTVGHRAWTTERAHLRLSPVPGTATCGWLATAQAANPLAASQIALLQIRAGLLSGLHGWGWRWWGWHLRYPQYPGRSELSEYEQTQKMKKPLGCTSLVARRCCYSGIR